MMKGLLTLFFLFALLGVGCVQSSVTAYVPGEIPTTEQLRVMTQEEKLAGMKVLARSVPVTDFSKQERRQELQRSIATMAQGDTIRFSDWEASASSVSGSVRVVESNQKTFLVFSDTFSTPLQSEFFLYLSTEIVPLNAESVLLNGVEIAKLKSLNGTQMYEVPDDIHMDDMHSIVILSKPFQQMIARVSF